MTETVRIERRGAVATVILERPERRNAIDPPTARAYGARWLAATVTAGGYVEDSNGDPAPGATVGVALALATAGVEQDTFDRIVAWLEDNVDTYVVTNGADNAGRLG